MADAATTQLTQLTQAMAGFGGSSGADGQLEYRSSRGRHITAAVSDDASASVRVARSPRYSTHRNVRGGGRQQSRPF